MACKRVYKPWRKREKIIKYIKRKKKKSADAFTYKSLPNNLFYVNSPNEENVGSETDVRRRDFIITN